MKQILTALIVIIVSLNSALAGQIRTLSASNAIDLALQNNLQIKQMGEDVAIAQAQMNQSFADFAMPKISANAGFTLLDPLTVSNAVVDPLAEFPPSLLNNPLFSSFASQSFAFTNVYADNYSGGISISKTLFSGFRLWNGLRAKQINLDLMNKKFEDKKRKSPIIL